MAALEKQVAIETGQWSEKQDVELTGQFSAKSITLSKVMTIPELEELERKMVGAGISTNATPPSNGMDTRFEVFG